MELRILQYFLAVAREQSISAAAESLHLSQPTLSVQLKALEEELGKQLLIRGTKGSRKVLLTDEGMILRKRAEEIPVSYTHLDVYKRQDERKQGRSLKRGISPAAGFTGLLITSEHRPDTVRATASGSHPSNSSAP